MTGEARAAAAAATLRHCRAELAARGSTVIREIVGDNVAGDDVSGPAGIVEWRHYPPEDVYDPATHAQYFYHRHPQQPVAGSAEPPEHGHFHLFLRGDGIPAGIAPLLLPEDAVVIPSPKTPRARRSAPVMRGLREEVCHLIAIAIDAQGEPIRLFTTNRWVTGETWYRAEDVVRLLDLFALGREAPLPLLDRWLVAMVRLFQPEIAQLLTDRDRTLLSWRWRGRRNAFEDPRLEITSCCNIDLAGRLARFAANEPGAGLPAAAPGHATPRALPRMGDGWGA